MRTETRTTETTVSKLNHERRKQKDVKNKTDKKCTRGNVRKGKRKEGLTRKK